MLKKFLVVVGSAVAFVAIALLVGGAGQAPRERVTEAVPPEEISYARQQVADAQAGPLDRLLGRLLAPGPLAKPHEEIGSCFACHNAFTAVKDTGCAACHRSEDLLASDRPNAPTHTAVLGTVGCAACHTDHKGSEASVTRTFAHNVLPPKILSACASCHAATEPVHWALAVEEQLFENGTVEVTGTVSSGRLALHENHARGFAGVSCSECHTTDRWSPDIFVHPIQSTRKALSATGSGSGSKSCTECHVSETQVHKDQRKYSSSCQDCHATNSWKPTAFSHAKGFGTLPKSAPAQPDVHAASSALNAPGGITGCTKCHAREEPVHGPAFGNACGACHSTKQWSGAAAGPLAMATVQGDVTCANCHLEKAKVHVNEPAFGPNCAQCHSVAGWNVITLDHSLVAGQSCTKCHAPPKETGHPDAAPLGITCAVCHTTESWKPATFNHYTLTNSAQQTCLQCHADKADGKHKSGQVLNATCTLCHSTQNIQSSVFDHDTAAANTTCLACHTRDIPRSPDHTKFAGQCALCHSTKVWRPVNFKHEAVIGFGTQTCLSCHTADYRNHDRTWFNAQTGRSCEQCHDTNRWRPANFNHDAAVASPTKTCLTCHRVPANSWLHRNVAPKGCLACHTLQSWSAIKHGG